jgi:hypothetical protein
MPSAVPSPAPTLLEPRSTLGIVTWPMERYLLIEGRGVGGGVREHEAHGTDTRTHTLSFVDVRFIAYNTNPNNYKRIKAMQSCNVPPMLEKACDCSRNIHNNNNNNNNNKSSSNSNSNNVVNELEEEKTLRTGSHMRRTLDAAWGPCAQQ